MKILSIPPTTAGGERNGNTWSFIWTNRRSNLLLGRVALLLYIYFNSRILEKQQKSFSVTDWTSFLEELEVMPELTTTIEEGQ